MMDAKLKIQITEVLPTHKNYLEERTRIQAKLQQPAQSD